MKYYLPNGLTLDEVRLRIVDAALRGNNSLKLHENYHAFSRKEKLSAIVVRHEFKDEYLLMWPTPTPMQAQNERRYGIDYKQAMEMFMAVTDANTTGNEEV